MAKNIEPIPGMLRQPKQARSRERVMKILDVADEMFITEGCNAVTTNAIAAKAEVPIGSLYQFFPDKAAIVQALAARYTALHSQKILAMGPEVELLPFSDVLALVVDTNDQFFADYPGYQAIYMQMQETVPELAAIEEAADVEIIDATAEFLAQRFPGLDADHYQVISMVIVKSIGTFLWLSRSQPPDCRQRLLDETKRLVQSYALSYWPESE